MYVCYHEWIRNVYRNKWAIHAPVSNCCACSSPPYIQIRPPQTTQKWTQLPLSWSVIPMVPPVLMTRTRASAAQGEVNGSLLSNELQLDNFLLRRGCTWTLREGLISFDSIRSRVGCDSARARSVRLLKLESAMMTYERAPGLSPLKTRSEGASHNTQGCSVCHGTPWRTEP